MSDYGYDGEHHHHHHHRRDESPRREEYVVQEVAYEVPAAARQEEYGRARPPASYGGVQALYTAGPYGTAVAAEPYGQGYGAPQGPYGSYGSYGPPAAATTTGFYQEQRIEAEGFERAKLEERRHKREEEFAGAGALAAGAFAAYEGHRVKTDHDHSGRHKLEEEIAGGLGVGAGGYALYEHYKKKESSEEMEAWEREQEKLAGYKKHDGWFG